MKTKKKSYLLLSSLMLFVMVEIGAMQSSVVQESFKSRLRVPASRQAGILYQANKKQNLKKLASLANQYFTNDAWKKFGKEALENLAVQYRECMRFIDLDKNENDKGAFGQELSFYQLDQIQQDACLQQMVEFEHFVFIKKLLDITEQYLINDVWAILDQNALKNLVEQYKECVRFIDLDNQEDDRKAFHEALSARGVSESDDTYYDAMIRFEESDLYK